MNNKIDVCDNCGTNYEEGQLYCPKCGTQNYSIEVNKCKKCETVLQESHDFCPKCGQEVNINNKQKRSKAIKKNSKSKKKLIVIYALTFIVFVAIIIIIVGELNNTNNDNAMATAVYNTTTTKVTPKTAIESLNDDEKLVYDALIIGIRDFFNPSQVRIIAVSDIQFDNSWVDIQLQGTNKFGGTLTKIYMLMLKDIKTSSGNNYMGNIIEEDYLANITDIATKMSVANINNALIEYWKNQGIL